MPEAEDHIEMESAGTEGEALHDKSIIPMDVEGSDSQPVQKQGQAGDKVVIDLEEANEKDNARKLAVPISTVASESAFSTSGRILDDFRTSLTPFMVEALVCAQDWLRRSTPIDIQENTKELEIMEKELIEEFGNHKSTGKENPSTSKSQATTPSATTGSNSKSISKTRTSTC